MGLAQGNVSSGAEGLQLVAWALVDGAGQVKQSGGFSSVTRSGVGTFPMVFVAARASARYLVRAIFDSNNGTNSVTMASVSKSTTGFTLTMNIAGAAADVGTVHVAVYE